MKSQLLARSRKGSWEPPSPFSSPPAHSGCCSISSFCSMDTSKVAPASGPLRKSSLFLKSSSQDRGSVVSPLLVPLVPSLTTPSSLPVTAHHRALLALPHSLSLSETIYIICPLFIVFSSLWNISSGTVFCPCHVLNTHNSVPNMVDSQWVLAHSTTTRTEGLTYLSSLFQVACPQILFCRTAFPCPMTALRLISLSL